MSSVISKIYVTRSVYLIFSISVILCQAENIHGFTIDPLNVKAIAIYGKASGFGKDVQPDSLLFTVTDSSLISSLISSIESAVDRDCSGLGAQLNAWVFIKYNDDTIEVWELFDMWSHISKVGLWGTCYYVSQEGRTLFADNVQ